MLGGMGASGDRPEGAHPARAQAFDRSSELRLGVHAKGAYETADARSGSMSRPTNREETFVA